ncbi:MAG: carboxypeptidase regulatory-like domain-containing protein [Terracidiphilus sp.]
MRVLLPVSGSRHGHARLAALWAVVALAIASSSTQAESVLVVADLSPIPYVTPGAEVTVLFDGKPMPGAKVRVWRHFSADVYLLATDEAGRVKLPELPAGSFSISASIDGNTSQGQFVEVCMISCRENVFEVTELAFDSLRGPIYAIDRSALGMSEISVEIAPDRTPGFMDAVAKAEQEPASFTLCEFGGVVMDQTGAVIPGASVAVVGERNQKKQLVSALITDGAGRFAAQLDRGDYYVLVAAQGFMSRVFHVVITPQGSPVKARITLIVGST